MRVTITGAAGFLGRGLAEALAARGALRKTPITSLKLADSAPIGGLHAPFPVETASVDVADRDSVDALFADRPDVVFHLAACPSLTAEDSFAAGMRTNFFGVFNILESLRATGKIPLLAFASSLSAGAPAHSSYGAQKSIAEQLICDYARRAYLDGRSLRLPILCVRAAREARDIGDFVSDVIRAPLMGDGASALAAAGTRLRVMSAAVAAENMIRLVEIPSGDLPEGRVATAPGLAASLGDLVAALGEEASALVSWAPDETRAALLAAATAAGDAADGAGMRADPDIAALIDGFRESEGL